MAIPVKDKGYSWVILTASTLLNMLMASSYSTNGIYYVEFIQYFQVDKTELSWIGACQLFFTGVAGAYLLYSLSDIVINSEVLLLSYGFTFVHSLVSTIWRAAKLLLISRCNFFQLCVVEPLFRHMDIEHWLALVAYFWLLDTYPVSSYIITVFYISLLGFSQVSVVTEQDQKC